MDENMKIKFYFFEALRKEYGSKFGNREWDGMALNFYYFKKNHLKLSFLGIGGLEMGKALLLKLKLTTTMAVINYMNT